LSNGQTEGQVHKLKLLKRQMYGRANFDLLRRIRCDDLLRWALTAALASQGR
jgi:hypothetical protein